MYVGRREKTRAKKEKLHDEELHNTY